MVKTEFMIMDVKSGKSRQLTDGSTVPYKSRGVNYSWSPDSKWILTEVVDNMHAPYTDIAIINVETGEIHNLTNSGYTDGNPRWALDGNAIIFQGWSNVNRTIDCFINEGYNFNNWIIWDRIKGRGAKKNFVSTREDILWFSNGKNYVFNPVISNIKKKTGGAPPVDNLIAKEFLPIRPGRSDKRNVKSKSPVCFNYRFD